MNLKSTHEAAIPNPSLKQFEILLGDWSTVGKHPLVPNTIFHGRTSFNWIEGGAFLIMHSEVDEKEIPSGIAIFGSDDVMKEYFMIYFDERKVSRKYNISIQGNIINGWRNSRAFSQRFTWTCDKNTIVSEGEYSTDGKTWEKDLEQTFTRII